VAARLRTFVKFWVDPFPKHGLLDHAGAIAFAVLKALVPLTLIGLVGVELDELLREDATEGRRGALGILGIAR